MGSATHLTTVGNSSEVYNTTVVNTDAMKPFPKMATTVLMVDISGKIRP